MSAPRLLVTGGAGFIGRALVRAAVAAGYTVAVMDVLTYAADPGALPDGALLYVTDIRSAQAADVVSDFRPDVVAHLAAETHVLTSLTEPARFVDTNVLGTFNLLRAVTAVGCARFLHVSTDEVYGDRSPTDRGCFHELDPMCPNNPYAGSKAAGESVARSVARTAGIPLVVARPCNAYGPGQYPEKFIPRSIEAALSGAPVTLFGDGSHVREWIYVDDLAAALLRLCFGNLFYDEVFNIGTGDRRTNASVADSVARACGSAVRPAYAPQRPGDDRCYGVTTHRITGLDWQPHVRFEDGLARTVEHHRARRRRAA